MPKFLFEPPYASLSSNAKLMYMMILDRYRLSRQSYSAGNRKFYDEAYRDCFVFFSNSDLMAVLNIKSKVTVISVRQELVDCGLVVCFKTSAGNKFFLGKLPSSNFVKVDSESKSVVLDGSQVSSDVNPDSNRQYLLGVLAKKWQVRAGCDVCARLLEFFAGTKVYHEVTAKEFWYIRNAVQSYEFNVKSIHSFSDFVRGIRKRYRREGSLLRVNVGADSDVDVALRIRESAASVPASSSDDILNYDWLDE